MQNTKSELIRLAMEQCAVDLNCNPEDFKKTDNIILTPKNLPERRYFVTGCFFFRMISFGGNAVIAANEQIQPWLREFAKGRVGYSLYEEPQLIAIHNELAKYKRCLWSTTHSCLPIADSEPVKEISAVKWYEEEEIPPLYSDGRFYNALQYKFKPNRPDVLAVASFEGNEITGMAGASADSRLLWQIGIDVVLEHRGKGLGTYLVRLLKNEILKRGYIPYYSTSQSNIHSQNIARNAGFYPAWVEAYSTEPKED